MAARKTSTSKLFREIKEKIESGELAEHAQRMAMRPERIRPIVLTCENIDCDYEGAQELEPSEFVDWLYDEGPECTKCECAARHGITGFQQIQVHGSWSEAWYLYEWTEEYVSSDAVSRNGRSDYWEAIVHFCTAEEFISIYRDRKIKAHPTGLYRKPAVCLTEATVANWGEIKDRHCEYGFIFRKRDIIAIDGAPAIYLPQTVIDKMSESGSAMPGLLRPYVNKIALPKIHGRTRHDYLHEREWRVPGDVPFGGPSSARPYAITFPKKRPGIRDENLILDAAREFHELGSEQE